MKMSPACTTAPQPSASPEEKRHPKYNDWLKYCSACAEQLVTASTFQSWLDSTEREELRKQGMLPYQIIDAHPRGQEYWEYSRAFHDKQNESQMPDWKKQNPLSFEEWLASN